MHDLKLYLEKFRNLVPPDKELKDLIKAAAKKHTGHELKDSEIKINKWTVYIKTKPALKSELFIKQEDIMSDLETALAKRVPKKIV